MMKKTAVVLVFTLTLSLGISAQTSGELFVSASTSETGGEFAPRNIVAIWIENDQGDFVKTLLAYAQNRKTHLNTWQASTGAAGVEYNVSDAITGPTRSSHATRECIWDGTDYNGAQMPDGDYYIWMELTDKNNTGNYSSFLFTKSNIADIQAPADVPSFASISIVWSPSGVATYSLVNSLNITVDPNPSHGKFTIKGDSFENVELRTISGKLIYKGNSELIDISDKPDGIYLLTIKTGNNKLIKKIVKL
ncbi:MAG: DUF2271 domain-containing protein [Bacteroidales bacterium]|nr:DUF2271 domain-containing protein [Bacteroidales bacterium]